MAFSFPPKGEFVLYGENFLAERSADPRLSIFSIVLSSDSSRAILANLNDYDAFESLEFKDEKLRVPMFTGLVFGGYGIGLSLLYTLAESM